MGKPTTQGGASRFKPGRAHKDASRSIPLPKFVKPPKLPPPPLLRPGQSLGPAAAPAAPVVIPGPPPGTYSAIYDRNPTTHASHKSIDFGQSVTTSVNQPINQIEQAQYNSFTPLRVTNFTRYSFGVPAGATIVSAHIAATGEGNTGALPVRIYLLAPDGIWNGVSGNRQYIELDDGGIAGSQQWDIEAKMQTSGGVLDLSPFTYVNVDALPRIPIKSANLIDDESGIDSAGQTLTCTSGGLFQRLRLKIRCTGQGGGPPPGNVRIKMYQALTNDGSDDRPNTSVLLGTSNDVPVTAISTAPEGALVDFDWPAPIVTVSGTRYTYMVDVDHGYITGVNGSYVGLNLSQVNSYAAGKMIGYGPRYAFSSLSYGVGSEWPHLFRQNGVTPHTTPFGSVVSLSFPTLVGAVPFIVSGLAVLFQEWVNAPGYVSGVVALCIQPSQTDFTTSSRTWSAPKLHITYTVT